jgi:Flp pilus assembly protein CpaB
VSPQSAVAYFIEPGSRVDVLATFEQDATTYEGVSLPGAPRPVQQPVTTRTVSTKTILQNVKVLAVGRAATRGTYEDEAEGGFDTVTVEVTPLDSERLTFAVDEAGRRLTLVLRNPQDEATVEVPSASFSSLE